MPKEDKKKLYKKMEEQLTNPLLVTTYEYAMQLLLARLAMIHADLSGKEGRCVVRSTSFRMKSVESIEKKLLRKGRKVTFKNAVETLNDIAGIRVVCYFCDDVIKIADAIRSQRDIRIVKEKDYIQNPKKSGYQSLHLIVEVPVTFFEKTKQVRVEIQIRSFAMDYWAELDTQMCYKKSAGEKGQCANAFSTYI